MSYVKSHYMSSFRHIRKQIRLPFSQGKPQQLPGCKATIHHDIRTGHVRRSIGCQETDDAVIFIDLGLTTHWHAIKEGIDEFLIETCGLHTTKRNQVHTNVLFTPIGAKIARKIDQARLGSRIGNRLDKGNAIALFTIGLKCLIG